MAKMVDQRTPILVISCGPKKCSQSKKQRNSHRVSKGWTSRTRRWGANQVEASVARFIPCCLSNLAMLDTLGIGQMTCYQKNGFKSEVQFLLDLDPYQHPLKKKSAAAAQQSGGSEVLHCKNSASTLTAGKSAQAAVAGLPSCLSSHVSCHSKQQL